jgi:hypothetical protein
MAQYPEGTTKGYNTGSDDAKMPAEKESAADLVANKLKRLASSIDKLNEMTADKLSNFAYPSQLSEAELPITVELPAYFADLYHTIERMEDLISNLSSTIDRVDV